MPRSDSLAGIRAAISTAVSGRRASAEDEDPEKMEDGVTDDDAETPAADGDGDEPKKTPPPAAEDEDEPKAEGDEDPERAEGDDPVETATATERLRWATAFKGVDLSPRASATLELLATSDLAATQIASAVRHAPDTAASVGGSSLAERMNASGATGARLTPAGGGAAKAPTMAERMKRTTKTEG